MIKTFNITKFKKLTLIFIAHNFYFLLIYDISKHFILFCLKADYSISMLEPLFPKMFIV